MTNPDGYVHKFRLEALDGAYLDITAKSPTASGKYAMGWIIAKFVSLSIAVSSLLILAAREIAR